MQYSNRFYDLDIHRHVGGLEMQVLQPQRQCLIHRHVGGLETVGTELIDGYCIHRHVGGLEMHVC